MNILHGNCTYFQLPQALVKDGLLQTMNASELKLYTGLLYQAQRCSTTKITATNEELKELAGLTPNSVTTARVSLERRGLISAQRGGTGYTFTLCSPATGTPLTNVWKGRGEAARAVDVDFSKLSTGQYRAYFEHYLNSEVVKDTKNGLSATCPFHDDDKPSLSIRLSTGQWKCWGCKRRGGLIDFERGMAEKFGEVIDAGIGRRRVIDVLRRAGVLASASGQEPEAVYPYVDEHGELLFEVLRYPGKRFQQRRPDASAPGGYVYSLNDVRRVLYRLPAVEQAHHVIVVEGEKDADNLAKLGLIDPYDFLIAVTTCPCGAGSWRTEYSESLVGKSVVIVPDMDEPGIDHARRVLESVKGYASDARIVSLPVGVKDVTAYLDRHTGEDFASLTGREWFGPELFEMRRRHTLEGRNICDTDPQVLRKPKMCDDDSQPECQQVK